MVQASKVGILIVDGEKSYGDELVSYFQVFGFNAMIAQSKNEALDLLSGNSSIKILVSDLNLKESSGLDLLKDCKKINPESPHVFLISSSENEDSELYFKLGAEGFLKKPFQAKTLLEIIRKSLMINQTRWTLPTSIRPNLQLLEKISGTKKVSADFAVGRGGFFIKTSSPLPELNEPIEVDVECGDIKISGIALLRWKRPNGKAPSQYAGLEFIYLLPNSVKTIVDYLTAEKTVAFIPSPQT